MDMDIFRHISMIFAFDILGHVLTTPTTALYSNDTDNYHYEGEIAESLPLHSKVIYGIIISCMVITCVGGNILTIISYCKDCKLRTVHNRYLLSLAASDLFIGCISMPFYAVYTLMDYTWPFGVAMCKVFSSIDFLACLESVFVIILVSYDRCMLVRQGADYSRKQTAQVAKIRIVVSWFAAFLIYVPAIISWDYIRGYSTVEEEDCDVEFHDNLPFTIATALIEFLIPLSSIFSLNLYLYVLIRKRSRIHLSSKAIQPSIATITKSSPQSGVLSKQISTEEEQVDKRRYNITLRRERKAARSLAILVGVFGLCWSPYTVCTVMLAFCDDCVNETLYAAFTWLLWGNSTLNPFLYALINERFRINFMRLLHLRRFCRLSDKVGHMGGEIKEIL